jgi:GAF domain/ANTAR domain
LAAPQQPPSHTRAQGPLTEALVALAGTPDDLPTIDEQLTTVLRLAADRVTGVDYASVTALRDDTYVTVAASSELALAVDQAQYADDAGPCLQSLLTDAPVTVGDIAATMSWPGFREAAVRMGLHASASIPLVAGSGTTIAVLNLYARDARAVVPLIAGLAEVYDPSRLLPYDVPQSVAGGAEELLLGCTEALRVHATIQRAIGVIIEQAKCGAAEAYAILRLNAADAGVSLPAAASTIIQQVAEPD